MTRDDQVRLIGHGWSAVETDDAGPYRWTIEPEARLILPPSWLAWRTLTVDAFRPEGSTASALGIRVNGDVLPPQPLQGGWQRYTWRLPPAVSRGAGPHVRRAQPDRRRIGVAPKAGRQRHPVRRRALMRDLHGPDARWRSMEKTMPIGPATVLFLCTGNSARSILAEAILNDPAIGQGRFRGVSAGSHPRGSVNPLALEILREAGLPTTGLRSKSWEEFGRPDSPPLDFVFTMCDDAAGETCPIWPGHPATAHWGLPDPAAVDGDDEARRRAFRDAYAVIRRRIARFTALPFDTLDAADLDGRLAEIGQS